MQKLIVITGGNADNVDKGITTGGIGVLLQANDYGVTAAKMDPFYSKDLKTIDCETCGEKCILVDRDIASLNHARYERSLGQILTKQNNITIGKILDFIEKKYSNNKIRENSIIAGTCEWIKDIFKLPINEKGIKPDICIIELCIPNYDKIADDQFFKALSELKDEMSSFLHIHIGDIIIDEQLDFIKKSSQILRQNGFKPDIIICKTQIYPINDESFKGNLESLLKTEAEKIIYLPKTCNTKMIPILLQEHYDFIANKLQLKNGPNFEQKMKEWKLKFQTAESYTNIVKIAIIGKFIHASTNELYLECFESIAEQLNTAAPEKCCKVEIIYILAQDLEDGIPVEKREAAWNALYVVHGICIPTACDDPGTDGIIKVCTYAREKQKPLFCFGYAFQVALFEFAQNVLGMHDGIPFTDCMDSIFVKMPENGIKRIGQRTIQFLTTNSKLFHLYGGKNFFFKDRFSNIFEIDPSLIPLYNAAGFKFVGITFEEDGNGTFLESALEMKNIAAEIEDNSENDYKLIEKLRQCYSNTHIPLRMAMFELKDHPYYIGVSYHPKCGHKNPSSSSPPFVGLIEAALGYKELHEQKPVT